MRCLFMHTTRNDNYMKNALSLVQHGCINGFATESYVLLNIIWFMCAEFHKNSQSHFSIFSCKENRFYGDDDDTWWIVQEWRTVVKVHFQLKIKVFDNWYWILCGVTAKALNSQPFNLPQCVTSILSIFQSMGQVL